ncbi:MAG: hypothetical protein OQK51_01440 [Kangiellaceae bacterium]|nr:hypothetical protein [Kangiellaceae bacterium]
MDIEQLKKKRQLNVQEQNALLENNILCGAKYWRENGIPLGLDAFLKTKGIDSSSSIFLNYEQDFPGCCTDDGIVLTGDNRFYEFQIDLSNDRKVVIDIGRFEEVTGEYTISSHQPGTGATWGYLAIKVLSELNKC